MENNLFLKIKNRYGLIYLSVISIFIILDIIASAFITNFSSSISIPAQPSVINKTVIRYVWLFYLCPRGGQSV